MSLRGLTVSNEMLNKIFNALSKEERMILLGVGADVVSLDAVQHFYPCHHAMGFANPMIMKLSFKTITTLNLCWAKNVVHIKHEDIKRCFNLKSFHAPYGFDFWRLHYRSHNPKLTDMNIWHGPFCHNAFETDRLNGYEFVRLSLFNTTSSDIAFNMWFRIPKPPNWVFQSQPTPEEFFKIVDGDLSTVSTRFLTSEELHRLLNHKCSMCCDWYDLDKVTREPCNFRRPRRITSAKQWNEFLKYIFDWWKEKNCTALLSDFKLT